MDPTTPAQASQGAPEPVVKEQEAPSIPKERLDQEISKRRGLEEQLAKTAAELDALKKQAAANQQKGNQTEQVDVKNLAETVRSIQEKEHRRELQGTLGLKDDKQVDAVQSILKANPELKPSEALFIAQTRQPDVFGSVDQRSYNPGQHGSLRPSGGGPPKVETLKDRVAKIKSMQDPIARDQAEQQLHGNLLRKVLGWPTTD